MGIRVDYTLGLHQCGAVSEERCSVGASGGYTDGPGGQGS